ncbi:MAG: zinc-binding alcohol dehydrogenase [Pseudomonadales bacterium]|nr:zinc-binding alcohol dehydrogenase [Pseudomonadales bacterium]
MTARAQQVWFRDALSVELRSVDMPRPRPGEVRVRTRLSAVSAGTELLVYRGQVPADMALDASLESLSGSARFPLQYGYACVGEVEAAGAEVEASWLGKRVFAFAPHASHFLATPESVIVLPDDLSFDDAVFLANMETAVNLVHDGAPLLGERVLVIGLGVVGLLLSALLARFPLQTLSGIDGLARRREIASDFGVHRVAGLDDDSQGVLGLSSPGMDLVYEVSGVPQALDTAIDCAGFAARILVGSWYGSKAAPVALGGKAHRNRLTIRTSQVSTLAPELTGRWDKARRFASTLDMLRTVRPSRLISDRVALQDAAELYDRLHRGAEDVVQAVFVYD